jgi:putative peptidoglycan lipid II flippase
MSLLRGIATIGGYTALSRVLGFVRDVLTASYLGAGPIADAFFVAFKFPNFFRRLFAEGAFNAAFVPLFAGHLAKEGREAARRFAEDAMAALLLVLVVFVIVVELAMPYFIALVAPGFRGDATRFALAVEYTRITFPYLLFISLVSLQGGVLNSIERFAAVAATPILLNLCLIGGLVALAPLLDSAGRALAWSVALAGVAQFLWLAAACDREGVALGLPRPRLNPNVRRLLVLMLPAALGSGVVQVNLLIDVMIASLLPVGAVSYLYYADRLYELPLAVIGIAIGTAILPMLAKQLRANALDEAAQTQRRAIEIALVLALPATAALIVLAVPIVATLFERGAFDARTTEATAAALVAYAAGLPAYVLIKVLAPCFYAREDTKTPVVIAIVCVVINTIAALLLMRRFAHVGIAAATALAAWINAALLARVLVKRGQLVLERMTIATGLKAMLASLAMAAALILAERLVLGIGAASEAWRVVRLAMLVALGLASYAGAALALGVFSPRALLRNLRGSG